MSSPRPASGRARASPHSPIRGPPSTVSFKARWRVIRSDYGPAAATDKELSTRPRHGRASMATGRSGAQRELLDRPAIAVRIAEEDEPSPREVADVGHVHASAGQLLARRLDVGHDQLQALDRAGRLRRHVLADPDRAARAGWRQLDEPQLIVDGVVLVEVEPGLIAVERDRSVQVRDGNRDELKLHVHGSPPCEEQDYAPWRPRVAQDSERRSA